LKYALGSRRTNTGAAFGSAAKLLRGQAEADDVVRKGSLSISFSGAPEDEDLLIQQDRPVIRQSSSFVTFNSDTK
jgi:hypothetical protein